MRLGISITESAGSKPAPFWAAPAYRAESAGGGGAYGPAAVLDFGRNRHALTTVPAAAIPAAAAAALAELTAKDFTDMIAFTRAGTATYVGADGLIETAAVDQPRIDYSTGRCGLLLEGPATNLLQYSDDFSNAAWIKQNEVAMTPNYAAAPDGTLTAARAVFPLGTTSRVWQAVVSPQINTFSVWLRSNTGADQEVYLWLRKAGFGETYNSQTVNVTHEWQRFSVTADCTASATTGVMAMIYRSSGTSTWDIQIWGAQLETGAVPTSYIPTGASAVTRPADKAQLAEPVAALLRRGEASVLVQGEDISYPGSFGAILSGPLNASYVIAVNQNVLAGWPALVVAPVSLPLNDFGMTVGWVADSFKAAYNGGTVKTRAGTQEAAFSSAYIGRSATTDVFARGWYYQLAIWPFCMADADLQAKAVAYA